MNQYFTTDPGLTSLHQLPAAADLVGRNAELDELERLLSSGANTGATIAGANTVHAGLQGMGGIGKTALAVALAHRLKARYPDAQLMLNLHGIDASPTPPEGIMQTVVQSFHPFAPVPDDAEQLAALYRSVLAQSGRVLLVLDNAAGAEQVRPLLPPPNCLLLVTSRLRFQLAGLVCKSIDCLEPAKSRELLLLLASRLGEHAGTAAELCGHLPLALEIFGCAVRERTTYGVPELIERLRKGTDRLDKVDAALTLSYDLLSPELQRQWTMLSIFTASFDLLGAAAVVADGTGEPAVDKAREDLQQLVTASLVEWDDGARRYRLHDLARQFSARKLRLGDEIGARFRHASHYCELGIAACEQYLQGGHAIAKGLELFDCERAHLEASFDWLRESQERGAATLLQRLVAGCANIFSLRFHPRKQIVWLGAQCEAARGREDKRGESAALGNLGNAYAALGEARKAIELLEACLVLCRETGDRRSEGTTLGNLGNCHAELGAPRKALEYYELALKIAGEIDDRRGEATALGNLGIAHADLGNLLEAKECYIRAVAIAGKTGDRRAEGTALDNLGSVHFAMGAPREAIAFHERARAIAGEIGNRRGEGSALGNLGVAYAAISDPHKARECLEKHLNIAIEIGDRRGEANALGNLGIVYGGQGDLIRAKELFDRQLVVAREIDDKRGQGSALGNLSLVLKRIGDLDSAIARAEESLILFESIESPQAARIRDLVVQLKSDRL